MLPARSTARLGMKRCMTSVPSGSQVVPWGRLGATTPPVTLTWYQRAAPAPVALARRTVCVFQSDSTPPKLVYWLCIIARMARTSSAFPPRDGALAGAVDGHEVVASGVSGPVKVESEMLVQSTWN